MACQFVRFVFFLHPVGEHTTSSDLDQTNVSASEALLGPAQSRKSWEHLGNKTRPNTAKTRHCDTRKD